MKKILIAAFIIMQSHQSMANEDYYFKIGVGEAYNPRTRGKVVNIVHPFVKPLFSNDRFF